MPAIAAAPILKTAAWILGPYIASMLVNKFGPGIASQFDRSITTPGGRGAYASTMQPRTINQISTAGNVIRGVSSGAGKVAGTIGTVASIAIPIALQLAGRATQAAGNAAGAGTAAAGQAVGSAVRNPDLKRQMFGSTAADAAGDAAIGMGQAAGLGVSGVANAVGSTANDAANMMRLSVLQNKLSEYTDNRARQLKALNLNPATAEVLGREISAQQRMRR